MAKDNRVERGATDNSVTKANNDDTRAVPGNLVPLSISKP